MNKKIIMILLMIAGLFIFAGCSQEEGNGGNEKEIPTTGTGGSDNEDPDEQKDDDTGDENHAGDEGEDNDSEGGDADSNGEDQSSGNSDFPDNQLDLKIGDTADIMTTASHFDFTVNSVELVDEIDGIISSMGQLFKVHVSVKNTGDEDIDLFQVSNKFQMSIDLEISGCPDISKDFNITDFEGTLKAGESKDGTMIFDCYESDEFILVAGSGLADAGVMNMATWKFTKEETGKN